ncbi:hypothetical protein EDD34_2565 [Myceligenerans xiligouense]|uniref:Streptogrisin C n=1 Tax=Myceligenerans xiligouense TaxID=253184 RepID=A0A3N4YQY6_9MICO|nr:hypothetical protein EDD34_2565 [Myceligenerans xiligouense]
MRLRRIALAIVAASSLLAVGGVAAAADGRDPLTLAPSSIAPSELTPEEASTAAGPGVEDLTLPAVTEEMSELASTITERYASHPRFASAEVLRDRSALIVHWHGTVPSDLRALIHDAKDVPVKIKQTSYSPGKVRDAAKTLMSDPAVASVVPEPDASALQVSLRPDVSVARTALASGVEVPVTFDTTSVVPFNSRQNDLNYHLGGARISLFEDPFIVSDCTSGFAVVDSDNPSREAMMTAAHCGETGSTWITSDGTYAYSYGSMIQRNTDYDGAIIDSGWSQSYVWTGAWDSTSYAQVHGQRTPYIGQEICYSGSYSGTLCGNIVTARGVVYNLGGDLTSVTGFRTEQEADLPAAGNGDSGGAGYEIVTSGSGTQRLAVGIISAGPASESSGNCRGVPGGDGPFDRKCSPVILSTSVVTIGNRLGWVVPTS